MHRSDIKFPQKHSDKQSVKQVHRSRYSWRSKFLPCSWTHGRIRGCHCLMAQWMTFWSNKSVTLHPDTSWGDWRRKCGCDSVLQMW